MDWQTILAIILGIFTILAGVSWAVLASRAKSIWKALQDLKANYLSAVADGVISDAEKAQIADNLIAIIGEATSIWQALQNVYTEILLLIQRRRIAASSAKTPQNK